MSQDVLIDWKEECEAIHREMDRLLATGWLETAAERQVRKIQFMALIERRNVAAQNFIKSDGATARVSNNQQGPSEVTVALTHTEVETVNVAISQEPSEAAVAIDRSPEALTNEPMFRFETNIAVSQEPSGAPLAIERDPAAPSDGPMIESEPMNVKTPEEPSAAAPTTDRKPPAPPDDPIFEIRNFLKILGLK
jgi:hypothetical protein